MPETPVVPAMSTSTSVFDTAAKEARVERMGQRLRQLVQTADATSASAVAA
jgi:hypothetical protein